MSKHTMEIGQVIDTRSMAGLQIAVMVLCGMVVLLDGYDIQTMALVVPALTAQWSLPSQSFSFALSSALIGIALGATFVAPLGDRFGRRPVMIWSMAIVGVASLGTGFASSITHLVAWRFLTGLGLGASMPNATALTSEYVPSHRRAALVTLMYCNVAVGAFTAGFVAPPIIDTFGWRAVFFVGGIVPLVLCLLLALIAPESVRFLMARRPGDPRIGRILARVAPGVDPSRVYAAKTERRHRQPIIELFAPIYRRRTILLWLIFGLNLFVLYLLISWLPTLLRSSGWSTTQALRGAVMIQAGGIMGGFMLSASVDRGKTISAMLSAYGVTAIALGLFTVLPSTGITWWLLLLIIGGGISGGQFALNALAVGTYPPTIRATGVGWAFGVGRIGAMLSPLIGGIIMERQFETFAVLGMLIIPVAMCAASVLMLPRGMRA